MRQNATTSVGFDDGIYFSKFLMFFVFYICICKCCGDGESFSRSSLFISSGLLTGLERSRAFAPVPFRFFFKGAMEIPQCVKCGHGYLGGFLLLLFISNLFFSLQIV